MSASNNNITERVVIIGNGIAGTNAARYIRKLSNKEIIMISEETLTPFSRTALMYVYMGHIKQEATALYEEDFWQKNRIQRLHAKVIAIDAAAKKIELNNSKFLTYDTLIIATGSKPNRFNWAGQDATGVSGMYHLQDLEAIQKYSKGLKKAVIVGGGLIGIELAEMLVSRQIQVTFLVREESFWNNVLPADESAMINRHIIEHHIDLRLSTSLDYIEKDDNGHVRAIVTTDGERIECGFVGLTVGVSPNLPSFSSSDVARNRGILVDEYLRSSDTSIYAIGDCAELRAPQMGRRAIEAIWYTGRMMGQCIAHTICGYPTTYVPQLWFNSAKFFDIEYQTYGFISNQPEVGTKSLYWEHPKGKKSIRINYRENDNVVTGFNLMGIRYRHEQCEQWLQEGITIQKVLPVLHKANFDPEFFERYEREVVAVFEKEI